MRVGERGFFGSYLAADFHDIIGIEPGTLNYPSRRLAIHSE